MACLPVTFYHYTAGRMSIARKIILEWAKMAVTDGIQSAGSVQLIAKRYREAKELADEDEKQEDN